MSKKSAAPILGHAAHMVAVTIRKYAFLSVTIALSFSLLLGYFLFSDSTIYNAYKELFQKRRGDIVVEVSAADGEKINRFLEKIQDQAQYYVAYRGHFDHQAVQYRLTGLETDIQLSNLAAVFLPDGAWSDTLEEEIYPSSANIVWLDNGENSVFCLDTYDVVISEKLYRSMNMQTQQNPGLELRSTLGFVIPLNVVGYSESQERIDYSEDSWQLTPPMFLSAKLIGAADLMNAEKWAESRWETTGNGIILCYYVVLHTEQPETITAIAREMNFEKVDGVYEQQNEALETIRVEKRNKAIIACALLLLLGINLYSSFINALNDRKFEIGVKRAIGASGWSIVRQFLYESLLVMSANIALSVVLVADISIVYKYIYERIPDALGNYNRFVLYISPYSMGMFGLCAVTLTVVFSLIFAYQSTQVEIVQYLKAE